MKKLTSISILSLCLFINQLNASNLTEYSKDDVINYGLKVNSQLTPQPNWMPTKKQALALATQNFPKTFGDFDMVSWSCINDYRKQMMRLKNRSYYNTHSTHSVYLIPEVIKFKNFIMTFTGSENKDVRDKASLLIDEIEFHIKNSNVTYFWYLDACARFLASFKPPSDVEKAIVSHAIYPGILFGPFQDDAHKTPLKSILNIELYDNGGLEDKIVLEGERLYSKKFTQYVEDKVSEHLPDNKILYPVVGCGHLKIPTLILANIRNVFPTSLTSAPYPYHGVPRQKATPYGQSAHDAIHSAIDGRRTRLMKHICKETERAFASTEIVSPMDYSYEALPATRYALPAKKIAERYIPMAVKKYLELHQAISDFHEHFLLAKVLPLHGLMAYKKLAAGLHWILHEEPNAFYPEIYKCNSIESMMELIVESARRRLNSSGSWESPKDPLETDPLTGMPFIGGIHSSYDDDQQEYLITELLKNEIIVTLVSNINLEESKVTYHPDPRKSKHPEIRFVDVKLEFMNADTKLISFTTLYHKLCNIDDLIALLNWSGLNIVKPDLPKNDAKSRRDNAIDFITYVQNELKDRLNLFLEAFKFFLRDYDPSKDLEFFYDSLKKNEEFEQWLKGSKGA